MMTSPCAGGRGRSRAYRRSDRRRPAPGAGALRSLRAHRRSADPGRGEVVAAVRPHHHAVAQPLPGHQLDPGLGQRHVGRRGSTAAGDLPPRRRRRPARPGGVDQRVDGRVVQARVVGVADLRGCCGCRPAGPGTTRGSGSPPSRWPGRAVAVGGDARPGRRRRWRRSWSRPAAGPPPSMPISASCAGHLLGDLRRRRRVGHRQDGAEPVGLPARLQRGRGRRRGRDGGRRPPARRPAPAATAASVRTALPAPPSASCTRARGRPPPATAARQSASSIGATSVGMASSRIAPVVTSSTRSRSGVSSLLAEPGGRRRLRRRCPEMSMSADPASSAWSRSTPVSPVRTTTRSGSAVRTSSVAGSHSGCGRAGCPVAGVDGGDRVRARRRPGRPRTRRRVSASMGTGLLDGSARTNGRSGCGARSRKTMVRSSGVSTEARPAGRPPRPGTAPA